MSFICEPRGIRGTGIGRRTNYNIHCENIKWIVIVLINNYVCNIGESCEIKKIINYLINANNIHQTTNSNC